MGATAKTLDFTGVPEGGGNFRPRRRKEGDYFAHIVDVRDHESKDGNETWLFTIKVDGDERASYPYYVGLDAKQLWKVRALFVAAGMKVPSKKVKADPNKLVGKAIGIALIDDEYEGRVKSVIDATIPVDDLSDALNAAKNSSSKAKSRAADDDDEDDDEEDETPPPAKKSSKRRAPEPEDDDEDDDEEEEKPKKKSSKKRAEPDDDDEDDEEDEKPKKKAKSKKKSKSDDDDDELDLDDL